jgi:putative flippase GtrA
MTNESQPSNTATSERQRFVRFLLVGGFAAGVNVLARLLLSEVMSFRVAVVLAYLAGMVTAFLLSKLWVFESSGRSASEEFAGFVLVNAIAAAQVWLVSVGLAEWFFPWVGFTWHAELVAHVIGVASPVVTSYFGHKYISFRPAKQGKT